MNGAEHWEKLRLPPGCTGPSDIAADPRDPDRLYLAAWPHNEDSRAVGGGLFLSEDGGESWRHVLRRDRHVYDVTISPHDPDVAYACGFSSSAWRSDDRGETWRRLGGFNFKWGHRVVPDPYHPEKVFITTFGGGVWYGPAEGDAEAREDVTTRALELGR